MPHTITHLDSSWYDFADIMTPELSNILNTLSICINWQMTETTKQQLLNKIAPLINHDNTIVPHNHASVREYIVQIELQQKIKTFESMMVNPITFEKKLMDRCALRDKDKDHTIPFHIMPESPTNKLYWEIATLVFEPETMTDMPGKIRPSQ